MNGLRRRRPSASSRQRGAALVETALILPVLVGLVLGMIEVSQAWRTNQTVVQGARSGARTVSQLGTFGASDQQAVLAVASTFGADTSDIVRIVIYEAQNDGSMPWGCDVYAHPIGPKCNVYLPADIVQADDPSYFDANGDLSAGCGSGASSNWCPDGDRSDVQATATEIGVFVEFEETYLTGFFGGGTYTITETTVMRIEPRDF